MADQAIYSPQRVLDANGDPVPGAIATFYAAGSLTMIDVWVDADGTILGTNPVIADADGYLPQRFVTEQAKVVITDADGGTIRTLDPVPTVPGSYGSAVVIGFAPTVNLPFSNVQAAIEGVDAGARSREAALGKPLRVDAAQSLSGGEQTQGRSNLGLGTLATVSPTGTPDGTKFLRDDNSWQETPPPILSSGVPTDVSGSRPYNNTSIQNTSNRPLLVNMRWAANGQVSISHDGVTWKQVCTGSSGTPGMTTLLIPPGHYYRYSGADLGPSGSWVETLL